jgi:hypothetical protein
VSEHSEDLQPGTLVGGRFLLVEEIGRGGMGVVYSARQTNLDRLVAIKLLRPSLCADPRARSRFEREARSTAALGHPGAIKILDFGSESGRLYIAMELIRGRTLRHAMADGARPLGLAQRLSVVRDTAEVLEAAHVIPLVHRDIKPENIFLETGTSGGERTVIADFGLALLGERGSIERLTEEGVVVGTPAYLSPEQSQGQDAGPESDVYALGCVLYELLTGTVPFDGTDLQILVKQSFAVAEPPQARRRDLPIPDEAAELVMAMLDKFPSERPTAAEVASRLAHLDPAAVLTRARVGAALGGVPREERMPKAAAAHETPQEPARRVRGIPGVEARVAVIGSAAAELRAPLGVQGWEVIQWDGRGVPPPVEAIFAPGALAADVARLCETGLPVLASVAPGDIAAMTALIRAGATDAIVEPATGDTVAHKLRRLIRRTRDRRELR